MSRRKRKHAGETETASPAPSKRGSADPGLARNSICESPPNENLRKFPDEVYGDTAIPHRRRSKRFRRQG